MDETALKMLDDVMSHEMQVRAVNRHIDAMMWGSRKRGQWRAVWAVGSRVIETKPGSYNVAHRLLAAASRRGRTGWVEEVTS